MNWNETMNINKKMQPKLGRRASSQNHTNSENFGSTDDILDYANDQNSSQIPIQTKKAGGWADETLKTSKNKHGTNLIEQERFQEDKIDVEDDIPVIPDIEEIQDVLNNDVAQAPSVSVNRVSTYKELDKDLLKQNAFNQFGNINLSHLTRFMYIEKDIRDSGTIWTKESLFNELIAESKGAVNDK